MKMVLFNRSEWCDLHAAEDKINNSLRYATFIMFRGINKLSGAYHEVKNMKEFNKLVKELKVPYVIDFYADWCGPCKHLTPIITKLEHEANGKWTLLKVNVDEEELSELV
jgi:thiol-disulfide isomerase/thioredoxin